MEILKTAVRDFDQGIISLGSSRSYKSSNHLYVNSEHYIKVPRESTYDAEMYRVLVNWLRKIHGYEITGQWHLEQVCDDGDYHHLYCDLTIKNPDSPHLEDLLEPVMASYMVILSFLDDLRSWGHMTIGHKVIGHKQFHVTFLILTNNI